MNSLATVAEVVLNDKELAARLDPTGLHITPWTIRRWRLAGGLPCLAVGRRYLFRLSSVLRWMDEREQVGAGCESVVQGIQRIK